MRTTPGSMRQLALLDFIKAYIAIHRVSPTFEEMRIALELGSKSGIKRLTDELEARGLIVRMPGRWRVFALGDGTPPPPKGQKPTPRSPLETILRPIQFDILSRNAAKAGISCETLLREILTPELMRAHFGES